MKVGCVLIWNYDLDIGIMNDVELLSAVQALIECGLVRVFDAVVAMRLAGLEPGSFHLLLGQIE